MQNGQKKNGRHIQGEVVPVTTAWSKVLAAVGKARPPWG